MKKIFVRQFGFFTVRIGNAIVYNANININDSVMPIPDIHPEIMVTEYKKYNRKWGNYQTKWNISYSTLDSEKDTEFGRLIMLHLEQHALAKCKQKYSFLHEV